MGGVWKYNVNTNEYSVVGSYKDPSNDVGYQPITSLIKGDNNNIYGLNLKNSGNKENGFYKYECDNEVLKILIVFESSSELNRIDLITRIRKIKPLPKYYDVESENYLMISDSIEERFSKKTGMEVFGSIKRN